jgi:hypothetical protein
MTKPERFVRRKAVRRDRAELRRTTERVTNALLRRMRCSCGGYMVEVGRETWQCACGRYLCKVELVSGTSGIFAARPEPGHTFVVGEGVSFNSAGRLVPAAAQDAIVGVVKYYQLDGTIQVTCVTRVDSAASLRSR